MLPSSLASAPPFTRECSAEERTSNSLVPVNQSDRARSSAGEHPLHTGRVTGSIPVAPTIVRSKRPARPRFTVGDTDRHGNVRWYFRKAGHPKIRLPGPPGSEAFTAAYAEAWRSTGGAPLPACRPAKRAGRQTTAATKSGYVYVIIDEAGPCKIGRSKKPRQRLSSLRVGRPGKLRLVSQRRCDDFCAVERATHALLRHFRITGEWFRVSPEIAALAISHCAIGKPGVESMALVVAYLRSRDNDDVSSEAWQAHKTLQAMIDLDPELAIKDIDPWAVGGVVDPAEQVRLYPVPVPSFAAFVAGAVHG